MSVVYYIVGGSAFVSAGIHSSSGCKAQEAHKPRYETYTIIITVHEILFHRQ